MVLFHAIRRLIPAGASMLASEFFSRATGSPIRATSLFYLVNLVVRRPSPRFARLATIASAYIYVLCRIDMHLVGVAKQAPSVDAPWTRSCFRLWVCFDWFLQMDACDNETRAAFEHTL
jgi:hypothetical protein